uniref:VWFA domain-containing protein n=1 Tax=Acrobeloides nanus TaxID=290746 RepID=A0A914DTY6_9BILA
MPRPTLNCKISLLIPLGWILFLFVLCRDVDGATVTAEGVSKWAEDLSGNIQKIFEEATKWHEIHKVYSVVADAEIFDPRTELKSIKNQIEEYLKERSKIAWDAKVSLESKELKNLSDVEVNDPDSKNFVRFMSAKTQSDAALVYKDGHFAGTSFVNGTRVFNLQPNVNFYGIPTSSEASAVHVPTPVYNRNPYLLTRIEWSDIDQLYRRNRERIKDLSFQKFCSESGFMRYFPAAPWMWDNKAIELDLFDCRSSEWFIDAATMSKNVLIMLDLSGSMLGQRFEIAKQTIEAILDTLSDNDFFNIMPFSKNANLLDECSEEGLLQATMRNKKLLRTRLANYTSEGKAEYEKALPMAFTTLLNLPGKPILKTKDEYAEEKEQGTLDTRFKYVELMDWVLVITPEYEKAIKNSSRERTRDTQMGCNDVIMLITDGAPGYYKEIFEIYNHEKKIRFFSFLIGEEAIDFDQVKWMACTNRGFMVHIGNMADVQEKVQHYVKVMSRAVSRQSHAIQKETAIWGSVARERMSKQYVISVGYPVTNEDTFMGVSAVSVPVGELHQMAHPSLVGGRSYFFMLDNNGYAMFHPQLRTIDEKSGEIKPTYNNMDFLQVETQQPLSNMIQSAVINCDNTNTKKMNVLFAIENMKRVYEQKNSYHAECIENTHFTIGSAIAEGDQVRLNRRKHLDLTQIDLTWLEDKNWRIHPQWRYCLLNDSDTDLGPEQAFTTYVRQMKSSGELPTLCKPREKLVKRLLLDIQATSSFRSLLDLGWKSNKKNGVHISFFATPSGLIRFHNESLEDFSEYVEEDNGTHRVYKHYVLELNRNSIEDDYFKRAVRMKDRIVVDINPQTKLWKLTENPNPYGNYENETLLAVAYRAIFVNEALVGVAGIEFLYDSLVELMKKFGCSPKDESARCFLLDEHAYVVYSSQPDISYSEYLASQDKKSTGKSSALGGFFGHLNRVTEWTMELLIKKGFYHETTFVDYQAMCDVEKTVVAAASNIMKPLKQLSQFVFWLFFQLFTFASEFSLLPRSNSIAEGYTPTFQSSDVRYPCQKQTKFYIANPDKSKLGSSALLEDHMERLCTKNPLMCAVKVYASWVEKTNLLLVVVKQGPNSNCYDETQCPLSDPPVLQFGLRKSADPLAATPSTGGSDADVCLGAIPRKRKNVIQCLRDDYLTDESELPCSRQHRHLPYSTLLIFVVTSVVLFIPGYL